MADAAKSKSIIEVPPHDRTAIAIVADDKVTEGGAVGAAVIGGVIGAFIGGPIGAAIGAAALGGLASMGDVTNIRRVGITDARNALHFQPGHPRLDEGYGRHPHVERAYIPLAAYHRWLLASKHRELTRLLVALGAVRVRVLAVQQREAERSGSAEISLEGFSLGGGMSSRSASGTRVVTDERYSPSGEPHVPSGLVWLPFEPSWQGLAERRIHHGLRHATVGLDYVDDYGVTGELCAAVEKIGGAVKGGFREIERVNWEFDVEFS